MALQITSPNPKALLRWLKTPVFWLFLVITISLSYSWMSPQISAPNERSRIYLTMAVVDSGTLSLNEQIDKYGTPFDIAKRDGHFYSDKAPGSSFLAVPAFALYRLLGGSDSIEKALIFMRLFVMVPFTLLGLVFLRKTLLGIGIRESIANRTTVAYALGTSVFHYGAAFYGHALVASAALGAALGIQRGLSSENPRARFCWRVLAGFSGGMAFAIEYQAALICVGIAIAYLSVREHRTITAVLAPALGASVSVGATLVYNIFAFGGPFKTSYNFLFYNYSEEVHSKGLYGITLPSAESVYGLLFSPSRGIILCAPLVFVGILALGAMWRHTRWLAIYIGFCAATFFLMAAGSSVWFGGWSFGPRLLVPIFGLTAIAAAAGLEELSDRPLLSTLAHAYIAAGIAYNTLVTTAFPELPPRITNPLKTVALPLFERGKPSPNLGMALLGLEGSASVIPLALLIVAVIGYFLYQRATPDRPPLWRRSIVAVSAVAVLFGTFVYEYPESDSAKSSEKFVKFLSSRRIDPK